MEETLSAGSLLAHRYRLIDRIGAGGMSVIWRARDEVLDRIVALKVLTGELAADQRYRDLVREEARSAAQLVHPHVTAVHDYGEMIATDGTVTAFVVMELLSGESLESRLTAGPLPWPEAADLCAEVAEALAAAHRLGIVHRDITPGNIMLTHAGVKVLDFGIATRVGAPDMDDDGDTFGTPAYVAPERLDGAPSLPATDTYALGVLLYETLTGRVPFPALTWEDLARTPRHHQPPTPTGVPGLPAAVAELCRRCLSRSPLDRPTAHQVAVQLRASLAAATAANEPAAPRGPDLVASRTAVHPPSRTIADHPDHPDHSTVLDAGGPGRPEEPGPDRPSDGTAGEDAPVQRPASRWVRTTTAVAAVVVALVATTVLITALRGSGGSRWAGGPGATTPAPDSSRPDSPGPDSYGAFATPDVTSAKGSEGSTPPRTAWPTATAQPASGRTVLATLDVISTIIEEGKQANEIRDDVAVDLQNMVRHLRESVSRGTAVDVASEARRIQEKVDTRRGEGGNPISGSRADLLDAELAKLASL